MKPEILPEYNSSYTNTSNVENGLFSQPELDQQLKNIISLIQVGLIDPKENPIIIGPPKDDESEKPAKLSLCDKFKIIGILVFLIIVTVVVTLCIIYMFVPFFARKNRNTPFKFSLEKSLVLGSNCQSLDTQDELFASYFGLIEFSSRQLNRTTECLGVLINPNGLAISESCLKAFDIDVDFKHVLDQISISALFGFKNYSQKIGSMKRYEIDKISSVSKVNLLSKSKIIEVDFLTEINNNYICLINSTDSDWIPDQLMYVSAVKINDTMILEKKILNNRSNFSISQNETKLNSLLAFAPNFDNKYQFIGTYGENMNI